MAKVTTYDNNDSSLLYFRDFRKEIDNKIKNPNIIQEEYDERSPAEIYNSLAELVDEADKILHDDLVWDLWPEDGDDLLADPELDYEEDTLFDEDYGVEGVDDGSDG